MLDVRLGGRHRVEVIEKAAHRGPLLSCVGNKATYQFACTPDRFGTVFLAQLANQLRTQQLYLLAALHLDPLDFAVGLGAQLFGDAFGICLRLFDEPLHLRLGVLFRLAVRPARFRQSIGGSLRVLQLLAHGVLAVDHQLAHRRCDIAPDQQHDDGKPDQLSDECRHLSYRPEPAAVTDVVISTPRMRLASVVDMPSTRERSSAATASPSRLSCSEASCSVEETCSSARPRCSSRSVRPSARAWSRAADALTRASDIAFS